jgi:hypothetical protein
VDTSCREAAAAVRKVYQRRLKFVEGAFAKLGFRGPELEMRARLFVCYHSWESTAFEKLPRLKHQRLLKLRLRLLTAK